MTTTQPTQAFRGQFNNMIWALAALFLDGLVQVLVVGWGLPSLLRTHGIPMEALLNSLSIATVVQAVFTIVGGWLGDRVGRRKLYSIASLLLGGCTLFYFHALFRAATPTRVYPIYVANILYIGVLYGILQGAFPALLCEIFPENVRYSGVSFLYQVSRVYSSGIWPYISKALLAAGRGSKFEYTKLENRQNPIGLVFYISALALVSAASVLMIEIYSRSPFRLTHRRSKVRECVALPLPRGEGEDDGQSTNINRKKKRNQPPKESHGHCQRHGPRSERGEGKEEEGDEQQQGPRQGHQPKEGNHCMVEMSSFRQEEERRRRTSEERRLENDEEEGRVLSAYENEEEQDSSDDYEDEDDDSYDDSGDEDDIDEDDEYDGEGEEDDSSLSFSSEPSMEGKDEEKNGQRGWAGGRRRM